MSPREKGGIYRKVEVAMWSDKRFKALSAPPPNAQTLWQYLMYGRRTSIFPGLVVATLTVIADDLKWPIDATHVCWQEIEDQGMAVLDEDAGVILLTKALFDSDGRLRDSSKPSSSNAFRGWLNRWDDIPECDLTDGYLRALGTFAHALGDSYLDEYLDCYPDAVIEASPTRTQTRPPTRRRPARDPDPVSVPDPSPALSGSDLGSGSTQAALPLAPVVVPTPHAELHGVTTPNSTHPRPQLVVVPDETRNTAAPMFGASATVHDRVELFNATEQRILQARALVASELGCSNRYVHPDSNARDRFLARIAKSRDPSGDIAHVIAVAVEEARGTESLEYLGWCLFAENTWGLKLGADPVRIRQKYARSKDRGCSSPGDVLREDQRRLDAETKTQGAAP